ncbi:MAG: hypothetical protein P4L64_16295 [Caulobacteraceae bacterium]|nr:hypothetical protein [Caulobacteraceae bacterium]
MAIASYSRARTTQATRRKPTRTLIERRPPSGDLINTILQYADIQEAQGGGRVLLRLSPRRIADPVISGPLGREAMRLNEVAIIWDEREDEIFRIVDEGRPGEPLVLLTPPDHDEVAAEDGAFELTPAALAYIAEHGG